MIGIKYIQSRIGNGRLGIRWRLEIYAMLIGICNGLLWVLLMCCSPNYKIGRL